MSDEKSAPKQSREERHDDLTATVKGIVDKEKAVQDAKTDELRKLRAARDAVAAPPEQEKPAKKRRVDGPKWEEEE